MGLMSAAGGGVVQGKTFYAGDSVNPPGYDQGFAVRIRF